MQRLSLDLFTKHLLSTHHKATTAKTWGNVSELVKAYEFTEALQQNKRK